MTTTNKLEKYVAETDDLYMLPPMESNPIAIEFLEARKAYLQRSRNHEKLLVPEWKLHPLPSIDLLLFALSSEVERKVIRENLAYTASTGVSLCHR